MVALESWVADRWALIFLLIIPALGGASSPERAARPALGKVSVRVAAQRWQMLDGGYRRRIRDLIAIKSNVSASMTRNALLGASIVASSCTVCRGNCNSKFLGSSRYERHHLELTENHIQHQQGVCHFPIGQQLLHMDWVEG